MHKDKDICFSIPKAELHVHLEGTFELETMKKLADKKNVQIPESVTSLTHPFTLDSFFKAYTEACTALLAEKEDFREVLTAYLSKAEKQGVLYSEVMVDI
jgi:adenosine deaminase